MTSRWQASIAALVLLVASLLAGWHHAEVAHGRCSEHGEEVHLARVDGTVVAPAPDATQISSSPWVAVDGDDHCQIVVATHRACDPVTAPAFLPATLEHVVVPQPRVVAFAATLYRLAPKTSPPVV